MKGKLTVSHSKFQYYRHNYCLLCVTGLLGCRWHRYQQSTRDNRKRDIFWFTLFCITFLYIIFYFYFWLVADNDYNMLEWYIYGKIKNWVSWYTIFLSFTCIAFGYFCLVMVLSLCHIGHGHQLYIHPVHLVLVLLALVCCLAVTAALDSLWDSQFHVLYLSLQMFGPFLHIGAVSLMTALMWMISYSWYNLSKKWLQLVWLIVIVAAMVLLYVTPLFIQCPCISSSKTPPKPSLFAHRGAEGIAPENTQMAFQKAIELGAFGLESDVRISYDGHPFIMHDDTFERTTNVKDVFPDRASHRANTFTRAEILRLNAGSWYLEADPFGTAGGLSGAEREAVSKQRVLMLEDLLNITAAGNVVLMFDVRLPQQSNHPYVMMKGEQRIREVLGNSSLDMSKLYWLTDPSAFEYPDGVHLVSPEVQDLWLLMDENISTVNVRYDEIDPDQIRLLANNNITTNVYVIDSAWFLSYYWCLGTASVTTRRLDQLASLTEPSFTLAPSSYLILWVAVDVLSAVIIIIVFIVQRIRLYGLAFSPESISLTSARRGKSYRSRTMKEKLLRDGIIDPLEELEGQGSGVVNHPAAYSMSSLPPSTFPGTSNRPVGPLTRPDQKYEVE